MESVSLNKNSKSSKSLLIEENLIVNTNPFLNIILSMVYVELRSIYAIIQLSIHLHQHIHPPKPNRLNQIHPIYSG